MRRADIARDSAVTGGADYLSTLSSSRWMRGRRLIAISDFVRTSDRYLTAQIERISRYGVTSFDGLPTVLSSW